jgi:hypothetical protein
MGSSALRVGGGSGGGRGGATAAGAIAGAAGMLTDASAVQRPLSRCMLIGQVHWPERLRVPSTHGGAEEVGPGGGRGGGACEGFATQVPFLNSCQGKHWLGSDCASAGNELKKASQLKMTAAAEKRVMLEPRCLPKQAENNSNEIRSAIQPKLILVCDLGDIPGLFGRFASAGRNG